MAGYTSEKTLVTGIQNAIVKEYPAAYCFKVVGSPYQEVGVPDLLVCVHGVLCGIEVKHQKPGETREHAMGRVTAVQRAHIARINRAGGMAGAVVSVDEALDLIERALRHRREGEHG